MYILASVFEMVSFPAFNVSMFIWSLLVAVLFFVSRNAASTFRDDISGTSFGSVWIMDFCTLLDHDGDQPVLAYLLCSSDFLQALCCHYRFSYDLFVVFIDVLS